MIRIATFSFLVLAACGDGSPASPVGEAARDSANLWPERGTVMVDSMVAQLPSRCSGERPGVQGVWTPTPAQVRELEAGLAPLLREVIARPPYGEPKLATRLSVYHRQYGGMVLDGRRIIYVNGFARDWILAQPPDTVAWRRFPEQVCDGWLGFFEVEYDPAAKRFRNLRFNGIG